MTTTLRTQENCTNKNDDKNAMCRPPMWETYLYHLSKRMLECHSCLHSTPFLACFMLNSKCDDLGTAKSTPLHGLKNSPIIWYLPWHGRGRGMAVAVAGRIFSATISMSTMVVSSIPRFHGWSPRWVRRKPVVSSSPRSVNGISDG